MQVTMKLYASLRGCLPEGTKGNVVDLDVADGTTIQALLDHHNVPRESCHLVLLNGVFQAPSVRGQVALSQGDAVAVWPPIAGG